MPVYLNPCSVAEVEILIISFINPDQTVLVLSHCSPNIEDLSYKPGPSCSKHR